MQSNDAESGEGKERGKSSEGRNELKTLPLPTAADGTSGKTGNRVLVL